LTRVAPPADQARCLLEDGEALAERFGEREVVDGEEVARAADAFAAFSAPDPSRLDEFLARAGVGGTRAGRALTLHRDRFPARGSGLGRVEEVVLGALAGGASSVLELMAPVGTALPDFGIADVQLWLILQRLADPSCALVEIAGGPWLRARVTATELAGEALSGALDFAARCGGTLWLGGVELEPGHGWRYDPSRGAMTSV
jgi:hypothetical protein